jgi:hypothetical protein
VAEKEPGRLSNERGLRCAAAICSAATVRTVATEDSAGASPAPENARSLLFSSGTEIVVEARAPRRLIRGTMIVLLNLVLFHYVHMVASVGRVSMIGPRESIDLV